MSEPDGRTVAGGRRATLIEAAAAEGHHDMIERWLAVEDTMPLPPDMEMRRRAVEPDPDR